MNNPQDHVRPQSDDPDFWDVWSRSKDRKIDWSQIVKDWQQVSQGSGSEVNSED